MVTSSVGEAVARRYFYALLQIGGSLLVDRGGGLLVTWRKSGSVHVVSSRGIPRNSRGFVGGVRKFVATCWQISELGAVCCSLRGGFMVAAGVVRRF
jgi:hypothetical protein